MTSGRRCNDVPNAEPKTRSHLQGRVCIPVILGVGRLPCASAEEVGQLGAVGDLESLGVDGYGSTDAFTHGLNMD